MDLLLRLISLGWQPQVHKHPEASGRQCAEPARNIGFSHAEYLGTMRDILEEKTSIIKGMKENGLLFLNGDDPLLEEWYVRESPAVPV